MKNAGLICGLTLLSVMLFSCGQEEDLNGQMSNAEFEELSYQTVYTENQLKNWAETGSPYLDDELDNSATTLKSPELRAQDGLFKLPDAQTRAFGVHPQQNRFWTMIRLKIAVTGYVKDAVVEAISRIEENTNIRFYNAIKDPDTDPNFGIKLPHVYIQMAAANGQIGSSYIGRLGEEQYIYIPKEAESWEKPDEIVAFVMRALCNVAGMYNEQQRNDRDDYVTVDTKTVPSYNQYHFTKITRNFYAIGVFDQYSITLASTNEFGPNSIKLKDGTFIEKNLELSERDKIFINSFYLPYVARKDTYSELAPVVYDVKNRKLTESERLRLQASLNNGNPTPPAGGHMELIPW